MAHLIYYLYYKSMNKTLLLALAATVAASANAQTPGSTAAQAGYSLTNEYFVTIPNNASNTTAVRSGAGTGDKWFVTRFGNAVDVYPIDPEAATKTAKLETSIKAPAGYYLWVSSALDKGAHFLAEIEKGVSSFGDVGGSKTLANHGFMVIDTKTNEVIRDFVPMPSSVNKDTGAPIHTKERFDVLPPIDADIMTATKVRILTPLNWKAQAFQFTYNYPTPGENPPTLLRTVDFNVDLSDFPASMQKCTTTGMAVHHRMGDNSDATPESMAMYGNRAYASTYSGAGKYGNAIQHYEKNWTFKNEYFFTPQHSQVQGFNFFKLQSKEYIIYGGGNANNYGDAFAISEVTFKDSPLTNMSDPEETAVTGALKARVYASTSAGGYQCNNGGCYASYTIEEVPGEPYSAYIYVFAPGAPAAKWKFTVPNEGIQTGVEVIEPTEENAPVEFYNLQGVRVANPEHGIFIRRQGSKTAKVIL